MKRFFIFMCMVAFTGILSAQNVQLKQSIGQSPVIDGTIVDNEYSQSVTFTGEMKAWFFLSSNNILYMAFQSPNNGWIGVGFGAGGMDKSHILIGSIENGKETVREDMGKGFSHSVASSPIFNTVKYKLSEQKTGTVFELSIPVSALSSVMQGNMIKMIVANGIKDSFTVKHNGSGHSFTLKIDN